MRGILYVQLNARSMSRDAHSGSAHLLPNAAWRLVRALSTLKDEDERVLIPGFYEGARPPNEHDLSLLEQLDMHETEQKESYGIESFVLGRTGLGAATAVYSPTANIAGLSAGYEGPGPKTVIPSKAMAKIDFRLIPDQDPQEILEKLKSYMHDAGFDDIEVEALGGERAATTPPDDPFVRMTGQTALEIYGKPARIQPLIGGSGPMHPFREFLDLPVVTVGIGNPENLIHAPNENIRTRDFVLGTRHMARLVERWTEIG
jgi:acetylornithine deacetylase/succinyl-diaminopimelate desuccinylase-like protein